ncbi:CBS domain-containing protein [Planctomyces sp. SH-PL62]|uniref:CBS domain-containing protein n=1 Tax=Planctomyces sp. SH-PL62 TaxID=1636152 RepID=UPI00078EE0D4|nr:CBS domain-containing protein [Planctomyces sp. SH-PL62]AMV40867.1 inosine 5'-monophosphate dehydrogenase [Planctomyces sp. SH-PL62]
MSAGSPDPIPVLASEDLTAADVMSPVVRSCSPFSTVTEAVMIFKENDSDVVPVIDAGKPVGVVVDRDVALAVADSPDLADRPVTEVMVTEFPTIPLDAHVDQVLQTMSAAGARLALVVDAEENLAGLIFWADLARRLSLDETGPPPPPAADDDSLVQGSQP